MIRKVSKKHKEACFEVADAIEEKRNDWGFHMRNWYKVSPRYQAEQIDLFDFLHKGQEPKHNCGTTMCIAGWATAIFPKRAKGKKFLGSAGNYNHIKRAADILGLDANQAHTLFHAIPGEVSFPIKTKKQAARTLRLLAYGEPDVVEAIKAAENKNSFEKRLKELQAEEANLVKASG